MKNFYILLFLLLNTWFQTFSQTIGIGTSSPDSSALLELSSNNKGLLPPRVALVSADTSLPVKQPATGLLVYNTATSGVAPYNVYPGYYYWAGSTWTPLTVKGAAVGDIQYWNGVQWTMVPVGLPGQLLQLGNNGNPMWAGSAFPQLTTVVANTITTTSAKTGGLITGNGGAPVSTAGVCYSKIAHPTVADMITSDTPTTGSYISTLTNLTPNTTYYARAYAVNSVGTGYGNEISFKTLTPVIGDSYQGGLIAYILQPGDDGYVAGEFHGYIAAPSDQGSGIEWGCTGTLMGTSATGLGTGAANTAAIVAGCGTAGIAAKVCDNLVLNGYTDWFLPSKDELNLMYANLHVHGWGGFAYVHYWSSSETNANSATKQDFLNGAQTGSTKSYTNKYVRAMRRF